MKIQSITEVIFIARNKEQNEKMKEEKKGLILKEALRQFSAKGLTDTKIKDIADGIGMAQGLLYHYYKSKEEIYLEILNGALDKLNAAVEALETMDVPAHEKIRLSILELMKTIGESEDFNQTCRFIAGASRSAAISEEAMALIAVKREKPYQIISEIIKKGQEEGFVTHGDPKQLAVLFWTLINGLAIYNASREDTPILPDADLLIKLFLKPQGE